MGIIDKKTFTLRCKKCNAQEALTLLQHGSSYGGSWQAGKAFKFFGAQWSDAKSTFGPTIETAKCKKCEIEAEAFTS